VHSVLFSALFMHYAQCAMHLQYERAIVVCYFTDDSWRKCRLLDHGYNAVAMTLGPTAMLSQIIYVFRILHWLLAEEVEKVEKG